MPSFCPISTVECTIADGFCQMMQFHMLATFQVGDGAGIDCASLLKLHYVKEDLEKTICQAQIEKPTYMSFLAQLTRWIFISTKVFEQPNGSLTKRLTVKPLRTTLWLPQSGQQSLSDAP